jgi:DNA-binding beta-propeller fold protein YncE
MKKPLRCLLAAIVTGVVCLLPLIQSRADTIYVGCRTDGVIHQYTTNGTGSVFARSSLGGPQGEAFDQAGNLYVANEAFNTITRFTTNGVPSTFAFDPGDNSIMDYPEGLAFDKAGNLYVANDEDNTNGYTTIEKFDTNGVALPFATDDGSGNILDGPEGLAFDTHSNLYVANDGGFISEFSPNGIFLGQFGDSSYLTAPKGVAFDHAGNLYVVNSLPASDSPNIVKFDTSSDGSVFADTDLDYPEFIAFDTAGNLYVANSGPSNTIVEFDTSGNGTVFNQYGGTAYPFGLAFDQFGNLYEADDGQFIQEFPPSGYSSRFATISIADPRGLGLDSAGNLYVANYTAGNIVKFNLSGTPTNFAFSGGLPYGLVVDSSNNVYVAASYNNQILKYTPNGSGSLFATDDDSGLILNNPNGLAIDSLGNLYAINGNVNTISKFTPNGNSSVFAGYTNFYTHGTGLAIDSANNVYTLTNLTEIGKFSPAGGAATPFANYLGDSAQGMAFDSAGNLYVADYYNGTVTKYDINGNGSVFATNLDAPESIAILRTSAAPFIPKLFITPNGAKSVLSWSTAAVGYNLYSTTNLAHPVWLPVSGTIFTNGSSLVLTNVISGRDRFFRLSNP